MIKIFGYVIAGIVVLLLLLRLFSIINVYRFFYNAKDQDEKDTFIEAINYNTKAIKADPCNQIDYSEFRELACIWSEDCNLDAMSLQEIKDLNNKLEEAITKCFNLSK